MVDDDKIKEKFGEDVCKYLKNKSKGGKSNQKGASYEEFFAIYQIAFYYPLVQCNALNIFIANQLKNAFVDDFMVEDRTQNHIYNFQLKNWTTELTWQHSRNKNAYCLWQDFDWQHQINTDVLLKQKSIVTLVLSSENNAESIKSTIPEEIKDFTEVVLFRDAPNLSKLINVEPSFKDAISKVCAKPGTDKLVVAAAQILAAWRGYQSSVGVSVAEIMQKVLLNVKEPTYICTFDTENVDIDQEVREILENIGIVIEIVGGYLDLQYPEGLSRGEYRHALGTDGFKKFEKWVKEKQPSSWEDIEVILT
jgi:hypothetical protein